MACLKCMYIVLMHMSLHVVYVQISRASTRCLTMRTCRRSCITLLWCTWTPQASRTRRLRSPPGEQLLWAPQRGQWTRTPSCPSELHVLSVLFCLLGSVSMGPNFIDRQRAKQSTKWRKLSCVGCGSIALTHPCLHLGSCSWY